MFGIVKTLNEFIIERQSDFPYASGDLSSLLRDIGTASKIINREVNKAGLVNILGTTDSINVQGEEVQKLDDYANNQLVAALRGGEECCVVASEEMENELPVNSTGTQKAKYVVVFDPLDGSSNIDVNASIGTIFGIYRRVSPIEGSGTAEDCMQAGNKMVAAGYVIYGSSTMLVYTTGNGVNGFTLDPSIGEFCLSHPKIKIPENGRIYSINESNYMDFSEGIKKFIKYLQNEGRDKYGNFSSRYIGTLVADFHRNLLKGGIFIYPKTRNAPNGKLRLIYENNPMAFIAEQADGKATNGYGTNIRDIIPNELHQRTPLFIGSKFLVDLAEEFIEKYE